MKSNQMKNLFTCHYYRTLLLLKTKDPLVFSKAKMQNPGRCTPVDIRGCLQQADRTLPHSSLG